MCVCVFSHGDQMLVINVGDVRISIPVIHRGNITHTSTRIHIHIHIHIHTHSYLDTAHCPKETLGIQQH